MPISIDKKRNIEALSYKGGLTLVELLVTLAIVIVVMGAVIAFQVNIYSYHSSVSGSLTTSQNAQVILKSMLTEVRKAAPGMNGAYPLILAGSTTLSFFSDVDSDGATERVTYTLIDTTMYRAVIEPSGSPVSYNGTSQSTTTLLTGVVNGSALPSFQYFDANYTGTSSPLAHPVPLTLVRLVRINQRLDLDPQKSPIPAIFTVQASLRNLKDNL